jgi:NAD(P)-dependent dehydrogenase (short-subunit alcohol dehydrogenase family)
MDLTTSSALVTGGSSGLGNAAARALSSAGAHVVVVDLPSPAATRSVQELGPRVSLVPGDVGDPAVLGTAAHQAAALAPLRVAVGCAGVSPTDLALGSSVEQMSENAARTFTVNLLGSYHLLSAACEQMARNTPEDGERGVVVMTSSIAAWEGRPRQLAYSASKAGIVGLTLPAARELGPQGIRVCTVAPGFFETPLVLRRTQEELDGLVRTVPFPQRLGKPEEYAQLLMTIVGNPMLNGAVLRIDGSVRMG